MLRGEQKIQQIIVDMRFTKLLSTWFTLREQDAQLLPNWRTAFAELTNSFCQIMAQQFVEKIWVLNQKCKFPSSCYCFSSFFISCRRRRFFFFCCVVNKTYKSADTRLTQPRARAAAILSNEHAVFCFAVVSSPSHLSSLVVHFLHVVFFFFSLLKNKVKSWAVRFSRLRAFEANCWVLRESKRRKIVKRKQLKVS